LSVQPSCSCAKAKSPPLPWIIAPGERGRIGVTVNLAGKDGTFIKSTLVTTDKGSKWLLFKVTISPAALYAVAAADRKVKGSGRNGP